MTAELCQELLHSMKNELVYPPAAGQRVWDWFWELEQGRQVGMQANAISWSDIGEWQRVNEVKPEPWELHAIYRMGMYRVNPDYDPTPPKPVSMVETLRQLKEDNKGVPDSEWRQT